MKYIKRIILLILLIIIIIFLLIIHINNKSNIYQNSLVKEIKDNYQIDEKITKVNKYNNNYVIITQNKIIVIDQKYKLIKEEKINKLAKNINNYDIIYRNNKIMYEKRILKEKKLIYEYYDGYTYEYIDNIVLEE